MTLVVTINVITFPFGMSGRLSSRSAFRWLTGNDVSGHHKCQYFFFWHKHSSRSVFGWSTGNDDSGPTKNYIIFFSPPQFFPPLSSFLIERVLGSKTYLAKIDGSTQKPFQTSLAILGPTGGHFGFCRRCGVAGVERVPPAPLGWYLYQ